ncbi:MAG: ribosome small subunit-dependent GTPase A [Eubacteriales bacterium]
MNKLKKYGASDRFFAEATLFPDLNMARVISQYKDLYRIITDKSEGFAEVSGKFRHEALRLFNYPAVGDFVMVDREVMHSGNAVIRKVLTRKSSFERIAVGLVNQTQVVAANIDFVFICMSLKDDYNLSRLERYLSVAWDSGAIPVVVLTKSDLCENLTSTLSEVSSAAIGVDIITTSSIDKDFYLKLLYYLQPGVTASFIGSSGVGKSTLINLLAGRDVMATSAVRGDGKGRHTTTRRELLILPQGGIVIDTPGMRELGVEAVDLSKSFADIDELISQCRFNDCTHVCEPGCAVLKAIASGKLDERRFKNYQKLKKEARYDGLSFKQIETEKLNAMFKEAGGMKKARDFIKEKDKRR